MTTKTGLLKGLVTKLSACPSPVGQLSKERLHQSWAALKRTDLERGDPLTPSILAGLVLFDDERFAPLLNETEHAQMTALARQAMERYQHSINPTNTLGNLIAATLKESI